MRVMNVFGPLDKVPLPPRVSEPPQNGIFGVLFTLR